MERTYETMDGRRRPVRELRQLDIEAALSCMREALRQELDSLMRADWWEENEPDRERVTRKRAMLEERTRHVGEYVDDIVRRLVAHGDPRLLPSIDQWRAGRGLVVRNDLEGAVYVPRSEAPTPRRWQWVRRVTAGLGFTRGTVIPFPAR